MWVFVDEVAMSYYDLLIFRIRFESFGIFFFFQAEDGIRDAQESRGLGDVYKRQRKTAAIPSEASSPPFRK